MAGFNERETTHLFLGKQTFGFGERTRRKEDKLKKKRFCLTDIAPGVTYANSSSMNVAHKIGTPSTTKNTKNKQASTDTHACTHVRSAAISKQNFGIVSSLGMGQILCEENF